MGNAISCGPVAPKPLDQFSKKIDTIDYVRDLTPPENFETNSVKGRRRGCACVKLSPLGDYFVYIYIFLFSA